MAAAEVTAEAMVAETTVVAVVVPWLFSSMRS
jgi:hypothetical protein